MPLKKFDSICEEHAKIIVSQDKGVRSPNTLQTIKAKIL